jgi:hypothetical protein
MPKVPDRLDPGISRGSSELLVSEMPTATMIARADRRSQSAICYLLFIITIRR